MPSWFRARIRHPFFPRLHPTPAAEARGRRMALSGTFWELKQAALDGASARRALFVTNRWNAASLTDGERDCLWELFRVPAYVMLIDGDSLLVGFECEAQSGFHLPGKTAKDSPMCECGRPGRLMPTEAANLVLRALVTASPCYFLDL
jgi:hypothetical protein